VKGIKLGRSTGAIPPGGTLKSTNKLGMKQTNV